MFFEGMILGGLGGVIFNQLITNTDANIAISKDVLCPCQPKIIPNHIFYFEKHKFIRFSPMFVLFMKLTNEIF